jgi:hypothetical protein
VGFSPDRLKAAFFALFRASVPRLDYYGWYRAKVVDKSSNGLLDVVPDDPRIPPMGGVPLMLGGPGMKVEVRPGAYVMVGWSGADPAVPVAQAWDNGDGSAIKITIVADKIFLGGKDIAEGGDLIPIQDGVVHGQGVDPFTGAPYAALGNTSKVVTVKR